MSARHICAGEMSSRVPSEGAQGLLQFSAKCKDETVKNHQQFRSYHPLTENVGSVLQKFR